jgi:Uma2 family endonuclease
MVAPATKEPSELLRPDLLSDGAEPEQRVVYSGISWERYLAFDKELGDDRPGPRLYYLDGELEIMSTSKEHERIKTVFGDLMAIYFEENAIEIMPRGQATMRNALRKAGAEPDESWCLDDDKEYPDLVLEIALTSGGIKKLDIYRHFNIPEVWFWRKKKLEIFAFDKSGYQALTKSRLFPLLDISLLEKCVSMPSWLQACRAFRSGCKINR